MDVKSHSDFVLICPVRAELALTDVNRLLARRPPLACVEAIFENALPNPDGTLPGSLDFSAGPCR